MKEKNNEININTKYSKTVFDIHTSKLKKMEYIKSQRNIKFDDDLENVNKQMKKVNLFSKFMKKTI